MTPTERHIRDKYVNIRKTKRHALAIACGRVPGKTGRPIKHLGAKWERRRERQRVRYYERKMERASSTSPLTSNPDQ